MLMVFETMTFPHTVADLKWKNSQLATKKNRWKNIYFSYVPYLSLISLIKFYFKYLIT